MMKGHPYRSKDIRSEAARWYNEMLSGDLVGEKALRFQTWFAKSPKHRRAYQMIDRAWTIAAKTQIELSTLRDAEVQRARSGWKVRLSLAASLMVAIGVAAYPLVTKHASYDDGKVQSFQTASGQRTAITLPDGTKVTLDSETEMTFYDLKSERRIKMLEGRAFFDVAKDRSRPFIVHVGGKSVRAIGTAFEISFGRGDIEVILAEGEVRVEDSATKNGTTMTAGRQLVMASDRRWLIHKIDVEKETSWTSGRLIFMNDPLSKALTEVNRYSNQKLVFENNAIPDKEIVGIFSAGDVEAFVKALELQDIAKRIKTGSDEILLAPA